MQIKLISKTQLPIDVMYTACRTCYSSKNSVELWNNINDDDKMKKLILKVLKSGHQSIAEHVNFTFAISEISRACANQLERHRHCSYSQQSLRYVEIKEDFDEILEMVNHKDYTIKLYALCEKYFINPYNKDKELDLYNEFAEYAIDTLSSYLGLIKSGAKPEDARGVLGLNFKTNLVMTCNLRELIHICNERLCLRAQNEIREMTQKMVNEVLFDNDLKFLKEFLVPKCKNCTEQFDSCKTNKEK